MVTSEPRSCGATHGDGGPTKRPQCESVGILAVSTCLLAGPSPHNERNAVSPGTDPATMRSDPDKHMPDNMANNTGALLYDMVSDNVGAHNIQTQ